MAEAAAAAVSTAELEGAADEALVSALRVFEKYQVLHSAVCKRMQEGQFDLVSARHDWPTAELNASRYEGREEMQARFLARLTLLSSSSPASSSSSSPSSSSAAVSSTIEANKNEADSDAEQEDGNSPRYLRSRVNVGLQLVDSWKEELDPIEDDADSTQGTGGDDGDKVRSEEGLRRRRRGADEPSKRVEEAVDHSSKFNKASVAAPPQRDPSQDPLVWFGVISRPLRHCQTKYSEAVAQLVDLANLKLQADRELQRFFELRDRISAAEVVGQDVCEDAAAKAAPPEALQA